MNRHNKIAILAGSFFLGLCFFAISNQWIIFMSPWSTQHYKVNPLDLKTQKKEVTLYVWKHHGWLSEKSSILWSGQTPTTVKTIVNSWFTVAEDEQCIEHETVVESVVFTQSETNAIISLTQNPFSKQSSTHEKLMIMEGLLKTIRYNNITLNTVQFLVHHEPIQDNHLDFTCPWQISGYTQS